ncbi:HNH endonuclease signature motif containing protein [Bacillus sp. FSL W8-0223]|uniref:HNH endonuclease signature motif containing protein n=1 Tax=Bacillus sp. FSL W8-0223 TaxID=2954595 RepID=UPI0030F8EBED
MKPKKRCNKPGCRELIDYEQKYCEKHKGYGDKEYNKQVRWNRDNEKYAKFYASKEWRDLRNAYISAHPLCERCLVNGIVKQAKIVHHKIEVRDDWNKRLDYDNLQAVCRECHNGIHNKIDIT